MNYYEYITQDGDRWDMISYKFYGTPVQYEVIIAANPDIPILPVLPSGIKLYIPAIEFETTIESLPPWKR